MLSKTSHFREKFEFIFGKRPKKLICGERGKAGGYKPQTFNDAP